MFKRLALALALSLSTLHAEIIESMHIGDVEQHIDHDTLIIFDIDNTLLETAQMLGSDQWFFHMYNRYITEGMEPAASLDRILSEWHAIQNITAVKIVEPGSAELIERLQKEGFMVMGLTTRGLGLSDRTLEQLSRVNVDFTINPPVKDEVYFFNKQGVLFRQGVMFTSGTWKGKALEKFLKIIECHPKKVVFINDKMKHLQDVESGCIEMGIEFVGLRYGVTDGTVASFDPDIAEVQFKHFGQIMSDAEAEALICPSTH